MSGMYEPVHIRRGRRSRRRRIWVTVVSVVASLTAITVAIVRAAPHHPPAEPLTLNDLAMMIPDAAHTQIVAAMVRSRIASAKASPRPSATAPPAPCVAPSPPHSWDSTQRDNATTIIQVGLALGISQ